jgi:predicted phage baseplate assembly protein
MVPGAPDEPFEDAFARATGDLWASERLTERVERENLTILDQQPAESVLDMVAPAQCITLADYERLARDVPGCGVARAVAVANLDADHPAYQAPGTISVVIVPFLPADRPIPSADLLATVGRYLSRRKLLGTHLVITGPRYVRITVQAQVRARAGVAQARVQMDILDALHTFLDPLIGGANSVGYPFGRDVYRAEILQVIDNVPGVDHVLALELFQDDEAEGCQNVCIGPLSLVTSGDHVIEVMTP